MIKPWSTQAVLNGVVHWVGLHDVIVSFDFKSETFGVMRAPHRAEMEVNLRLCITVFGESLSLIDERLHMNETYCNIWVMKEYGVENTWTLQLKIDTTPVPHLRQLFDWLRILHGFRNNGDVLLQENSDSGDLVSYDPKSRNVKKLGIRGCDLVIISHFLMPMLLFDILSLFSATLSRVFTDKSSVDVPDVLDSIIGACGVDSVGRVVVNSTTVYVNSDLNSTTVYVNSDCEQYQQKLIRNGDEHEMFFIKVGSPGSAYASPAVRPPFVKAVNNKKAATQQGKQAANNKKAATQQGKQAANNKKAAKSKATSNGSKASIVAGQ
ncbi:hypothetical protein LguiA_022340 [Lonicera macranthoides]